MKQGFEAFPELANRVDRDTRGGRAPLEKARKDKSILFSAPMICALLAGRKTQTRRLAAPRWKAGDLVWVREAWGVAKPYDGLRAALVYAAMGGDTAYCVDYLATPRNEGWTGRARPSIHMPRWASRLTLEIVATRQERLQDISYEDCRDEGVICPIHGERKHVACTGLHDGYRMLWDDINGAGSNAAWALNPFVWVTTFTLHKANIDAVRAGMGRAPCPTGQLRDTDKDTPSNHTGSAAQSCAPGTELKGRNND